MQGELGKGGGGQEDGVMGVLTCRIMISKKKIGGILTHMATIHWSESKEGTGGIR